MFVAIDEENKRVYGPFDSQEKGEAWAEAFIQAVEHPEFELGGTVNLVDLLWNVQEVTFVDQDDRTFEAFLHSAATVERNTVRGDLNDLG